MKELRPGDDAPRIGEHVMVAGVRCIVADVDSDGRVTCLPLEDVPGIEAYGDAVREAKVREANDSWYRVPYVTKEQLVSWKKTYEAH